MRVYVLTEAEFVLLDDTELDDIQNDERFEFEDELDLLYETSPLFNIDLILSEAESLDVDDNYLTDVYNRIDIKIFDNFLETNVNKIKIKRA